MYKSFTIKGFRCFKELTVEPLDQVNLIAGMNNVGKTTLLEALWLHQGPDNPELGLRVNRFRGLEYIDPKEFLLELFRDFDRDSTIELSGTGDWDNGERLLRVYFQEREITEIALTEQAGREVSVQERSSAGRRASDDEIVLEYTDESGSRFTSRGWMIEGPAGPGVWAQAFESRRERVPKQPSAIYLAARHRITAREDAERFGAVLKQGYQQQVVTILQGIDPRLSALTVIPTRESSTIWGDLGVGKLMPVPLMGDGMARLLSLAVAIANASNGMVLVDEVENGLHHSVMVNVWKWIAAFARKFNVQVFATTHSEECIRSAHQAFEEDELYDFRLHRLDRVDGVIRSVTFDKETLGTALASGLEVR